jgi:type II secretion system protein D
MTTFSRTDKSVSSASGVFRFFGILSAVLALGLASLSEGRAQTQTPPPAPVPQPEAVDDGVQIDLPKNSVDDVLGLYEMLTGKRLVKDANLAGAQLSVTIPGKVPRKDAVAFLEQALLLNGYSLVPVDDATMKVLGPQRSFLGEAVPLYADPAALPQGEQIVSYFMILRNISTKDAMVVFESYVRKRDQGQIVAVPNSNAILITDNTPLIRRLIAVQRLIDVPGAKILTEFVPLTRADAEKVAEIVNKLLEQERKDDTRAGAGGVQVQPVEQRATNQPQNPNGGGAQPAAPAAAVVQGGGGTMTPTNALIQIVADVRTNRVLVVAPESRMGYLRKLITDLDVPVSMEDPLERTIKFQSAAELLPVLQNTLAEGDDKEGGQHAQQGNQQASPQESPQSTGSDSGNSFGGGGSGFGGLGSSSGAPSLQAPTKAPPPSAVSVGKIRIIADSASNKIIVFGPPEAKNKAAKVLDMLDQRPKQVYLATIIGQLTLTDGLEVGFDYLLKFTNFNPGGPASGLGGLLRSRTDVLPDPTSLVTNTAVPLLSGLTLYGTIAETVDIYAKALVNSSNFKVLSRPVIYTANNTKAVISSGQQVPIAGQTLSTVTNVDTNNPNLSGNSVASTTEYIPVVLRLEVVPRINSADEVTLQVVQQNDNILERVVVSNNEVPVIGTQSLTTQVTVKNRTTVILGGLITEEETNSKTGIPLLSSVPGVGYLFSTTKKNKTRRELIVLIQPLIINSDADLAEAQYIERSMSNLKNDLYDDPVPVKKANSGTEFDKKRPKWSLLPPKKKKDSDQ